jgi:acyl-CoA synthetase (AMP-forming)/AMP-acid ligase II
VGVPDDRFGSRVAAAVQRRPGATVDEAELDAHLRDRLSGYKVPRSWAFVDRCQRLVSGKPDYAWARDAVVGATAAESTSR